MKNIGNVIFVVEGGRPETGGTELRLLKKIFADILGYEVQELRRGSEEFIAHGQHPQFRVFALNLPKNQLTQLTEDAMDELFCRLREEFHIKHHLHSLSVRQIHLSRILPPDAGRHGWYVRPWHLSDCPGR